MPSEPIWIEDGLKESSLIEALAAHPWLGTPHAWETLPERLRVSLESEDGSGLMVMDQPLSSFAGRRFGARFVRSDWVPFPKEAAHVPA